jgi:hypothetical protein
MDLSDDELQRRADADRREGDPPIRVETATWSKAGQLDWWVKERQQWLGRDEARTAVNDGSELLIFVPRAAHGHDLSSQFVAGRQARARSETAPRIGPNARKSAL